LGLAGSNEELEQLVEMATRLGKQTLSVTQRVEDFTALLANQSTRRLDNFGISAAGVTNRVAELKKLFPETAKETLWLQAAMEGGRASLAALGERSGDTLSKIEKLKAKMSDLRLEIAKGIAPTLADAAERMLEAFEKMDPSGDGSPSAGISKMATDIVWLFDRLRIGLQVVFETIHLGVNTVAAAFATLFLGLAEMTEKPKKITSIGLLTDFRRAQFGGLVAAEEESSTVTFLSALADEFIEGMDKNVSSLDKLLRELEARRPSSGGNTPKVDVPKQSPAVQAIVDKIDESMMHGPSRDDIRSLIMDRNAALEQQLSANKALIADAERRLAQPAQIFAEAQAAGGAGFLRATMGLNTQNRQRQAEIQRDKEQLAELRKINNTLEKSLGEGEERIMEISY